MESQQPIGAGLGSSASFSVTLGTALLTYFGFINQGLKSKAEVANASNFVQGSTVAQPTEEDSEMINKWAFLIERLIHGTPSGVDNSVATFGGVVSFFRDLKSETRHMDIIKQVPNILRILIVNTNVPRDTGKLVGGVRERREKEPEKYNKLNEDIEGISEKCLSLFAEYKEAEKATFYQDLQSLIVKNHELLNEMGVGHPSLDEVVKVAAEFGLHAKLTGAGGGGCAFVLLRDDTKEETLQELKKRYSEKGFSCYESGIGSEGVLIHF